GGVHGYPRRGACAPRRRSRRGRTRPQRSRPAAAGPGRLKETRPMRSLFHSLRYYLTDYRVLAAVALLSAAALMYFGSDGLATIGVWAVALVVLAAALWGLAWIVRRLRGRGAAKKLDAMVEEDADRAVANAGAASRADTEALRER